MKVFDPIGSVAPLAGPSATSPFSLTLSQQQQALARVLDERDAKLGAMYRGGLKVLEDVLNPERFVQCGHSMRELMEKLPELLDVPAKTQRINLKDKVRLLEQTYASVQKNTNSTVQKIPQSRES